MKKYIVFIAAALLAAGCGKEEATPSGMMPLVFSADLVAASSSDAQSKTSLGSDWSVSWNEGDAISILWKGGKSTSQAQIEDAGVRFEAVVDEASDYYAVYPSTVAASVLPDGSLSLQVPSVQDGSFASCAIIVSHTTRQLLDFGRFRSAVSLVRFVIDDASITRVRFSSAGEDDVCGSVETDAGLSAFTARGSSGLIDVNVGGKGTYYLSMLPGLSLKGLSFRLGTDSSWKGAATSDIPVSLSAGDVLCVKSAVDSHIEVEGNYYISVDGAGSKDGSSAANAGDAAFLRSLLSDASSGGVLDGRTVFVASGTYDLALGENGLALSYDVPARFTLQGESGTVFTTSLSGAQGCILTVNSENVNLTVKGITFTGASHDGAGGAVCLTAGNHSFDGCVFVDNECTSKTSDRTGGAVYVGGSATAGFSACIFEHNKTAVTGGAALGFHAPGTCTVLNCKFVRNGEKTIGNGGAVLQKNEDCLLYVVGCSFDSNACATNGPDIFVSKGKALMLYNCTSVNPVNNSAGNLGFVRSNAPMFIGNCTYSSPKVGEANGCVSFGVSGADENMAVNNLVLCDEGNSFSSAFTNSNPGKQSEATSRGYNVSTKAPNIVWAGDGAAADLSGISYSSIFASPAELSAEGAMVWEGPAAKLSGFSCASAAAVRDAINAYPDCGEAFYQWLTENDAFAIDGAGNPRGEQDWWPGAYQAQ